MLKKFFISLFDFLKVYGNQFPTHMYSRFDV